MAVNKDEILLDWAQGNPYLTKRLTMVFLNADDGSCAIVPISGEAEVQSFIDGSSIKQYDFMLQVMFRQSEATDSVNTDNMFTLRMWQEWIEEQEETANYPDFGSKCSNYQLLNLANGPQVAAVFENGYVQYQFPARLIYEEER